MPETQEKARRWRLPVCRNCGRQNDGRPHLHEITWDFLEVAEVSELRAEFERELELDVLREELRHIAERGYTPNGAIVSAPEVLTWAEGWFLQLSTDFEETK